MTSEKQARETLARELGVFVKSDGMLFDEIEGIFFPSDPQAYFKMFWQAALEREKRLKKITTGIKVIKDRYDSIVDGDPVIEEEISNISRLAKGEKE